MTQAEQALLIDYLVDAGELDPEGDLEEQFLDWRQVREETVSGETHYKVVLDAARIKARSFEEGRRAGRGRGEAGLGPVGEQPGLSPLHRPCPPGGGLTSRTPRKNRRGGP